ncbi:Eco57I restriction-modification methylase domain-containing protein [Sinorhizobium meliloti]|uniref:Eco57I restriction-modification methylase domain-containing protein n=1 Tax=Rhizobium meliloti TaxID=382 RepID=UPI0018658D35|nr:type IIL restriction-modification enzyme MmeI [Sinorhizobium meliloti]
MSYMGQHSEWLSLIEVSGPFLAEPVLKDAFPQGLEGLDGAKKKLVRQAYDEWREAIDLDDPDALKIHRTWIELVLRQGLELDEDGLGEVLKRADDLPNVKRELREHGVTLTPDFAVVDGQSTSPLMLIAVYEPQIVLGEAFKQGTWSTSPGERMVELCRATGVRLGLVTNGEQWMLVDAPVGAVTTFASWYGRLWSQEPITLQAFVSLLGIRRFFVDRSEQLPALLDNSLKYQDEVTDALGEQVRRAVEVLIQALDRAHVDSNRTLLEGVEPTELYEAGLTVMMRIVFLLSAEERGLLLLGDELYEANYAVSTLRSQLRAESEEILERRWDAWSRLLSLFRAVYGGIDHEALRLPALGGSLFDPDRFPFLEGRARGSRWKVDMARPLPIDNRTVLLLLEAVQLFRGRTLSYMALDVEQIGYVYEGLLERTVVRAAEFTLDLDATKGAGNPWVTLPEIEDAAARGSDALEKLFKERTESSASRVRNDLNRPVDENAAEKLLTACHADRTLRDRVKPYFHFLRTDPWGYPLVYPRGTFMVASGSDRRETGSHYTPKSLTEAIVKETLEPVVYIGPAEGELRDEWKLKTPAEILDLKICDPAMGSGAFLVQGCRWLSERLVEAWGHSEAAGYAVTAEGMVVEKQNGREPLRSDPEERLLTARRLIAEHCLYGVDVNPLAVELAKLSIWLVTLAKGRPFGFLDHNLRSGDSLLGISGLDQLLYLDMSPGKGGSKKLFAAAIDKAIEKAVELRLELRSRPIRDIRDVELMANLDEEARAKLLLPELVANALTIDVLAAKARAIDTASLSIEAGRAIDGDSYAIGTLRGRVMRGLSTGGTDRRKLGRPFHWPLEFPEVFRRQNPGFDAIIGNPPFLGGRRIRAALGEYYLNYLTDVLISRGSANANLCSYFFLRAAQLVRLCGAWGFIATSSIREGDSRRTALNPIVEAGNRIYQAISLMEWPGNAAVTISLIWTYRGNWAGRIKLDGSDADSINAGLAQDNVLSWEPKNLPENKGTAFQGSNILGKGFVLEPDEAAEFLKSNPRSQEVIKPFLTGADFVANPSLKSEKFVIDFGGMPLSRETAPEGYIGPVAEDYPECLGRVIKTVKPERLQQKRKPYREKWWQFAERCTSLYSAISDLPRVIFQPSPSKHLAFCFVDRDQVFSGPHTVIASDDWGILGALVSSAHAEWCGTYCSTMPSGSRRYNPADFLKFPFPEDTLNLRSAAKLFDDKRCTIMQTRSIGIGSLLDELNDENCTNLEVLDLRQSLRNLDVLVFQSYGWLDLEPDYEFRVVGKHKKFALRTIVAKEVMVRLKGLNNSYSERAPLQKRFDRGAYRNSRQDEARLFAKLASDTDDVGSEA